MALENLVELIPNSTGDDNSPSRKHLVEYYARIGTWCNQAREEGVALQEEIPELRDIQQAIDYLMSLQWKENLPSYRAKPVSNEMFQMFWESVGLLTDIRPMFHITDVGMEGGYSKIEDILNRLAKKWAATSHFQKTYAFCTMFAMLTTAPAKIYWNPFAHGWSGAPEDGDISFKSFHPRDLLRLGMGDHLQDDECVIHRQVRTIDWIRRAYPRMGKLVQPEEKSSRYTVEAQTPVEFAPKLFQTMSPGMKRLVGGGDRSLESVYPRATIYEFWKKDDSINSSRNTVWMGPKNMSWGYWVKPGEKLYPRGRVIIQANDVILYDEPNPYYHRKFPFALLGLYDVPWQQYAMSVVSPWIKQQDILNQIMYGLVQTVKKAVSPTLMAANNSISPEAMRAIDSSKPNLKLTYKQMGGPPVWSQPPNIGNFPIPVYQMILKSMKQASGASAIDEAMGKKQVPGGDTLDRISFGKNTPIRLMGRNSEDFLDEIGEMFTGDVLQFYNAERRIELLGGKGLVKEDIDGDPGTLIPGGVNSESFVRRYKFKCDRNTLLNVQQQERIPIVLGLRKNKDLSRNKMFEELNWNINLKENDAELLEELKQMAAVMPQKPARGHK